MSKPVTTADAINGHAAELALLRIMVFALFDQAQDKAAFIRRFDRDCEDHVIRAMNSTMPEAFFSTFQATAAVYRQLLVEGLAQRA